MFISVDSISKTYGIGGASVQALSDISFSAGRGEYLLISGPSGCGKSTLLNHLAGLLHPDSGSITIDGISLYNGDLDADGLARFRNEYIGFIFQSFYLMPYLTACENVMLPLASSGVPKKEIQAKADQLLDKLGLYDRRTHLPGELSGGQQQRVAIARALINDPCILLADEPTGNLDSGTREGIYRLLDQLNEEGLTILMVSHDSGRISNRPREIRLLDGVLV